MTLSYKVIWGPYKYVPQRQQQQQPQLGRPFLDLTAAAAGKKINGCGVEFSEMGFKMYRGFK